MGTLFIHNEVFPIGDFKLYCYSYLLFDHLASAIWCCDSHILSYIVWRMDLKQCKLHFAALFSSEKRLSCDFLSVC